MGRLAVHRDLEGLSLARPRVAELGCGAGDPISNYFLTNGYSVTGIDYAPSMVALGRCNFPDGTWHVQDMRDIRLNEKFDGLISWNGLFHLTVAEQRALIPQLVDYLHPGGGLMLTIGPQEGEVTGTVAGQSVYHASLDPREYTELLTASGFDPIEITLEDPNCGHHSILLARKQS